MILHEPLYILQVRYPGELITHRDGQQIPMPEGGILFANGFIYITINYYFDHFVEAVRKERKET